MKLSAPIYALKRRARRLAREQGIALNIALNRIAVDEGFGGWSLLAARYADSSPVSAFYGRLAAGDLVLVGARPRQGKTLLGVRLAIEAMSAGHNAGLFTLEATPDEVEARFDHHGRTSATFGERLLLDCSDAISAGHVIDAMASHPRGSLAMIDYLQLLDQKRENPPLNDQLRALADFARAAGQIVVVTSQIDRRYDPAQKAVPDMRDIRMPNPFDRSLFSKACFVQNGEMRFVGA